MVYSRPSPATRGLDTQLDDDTDLPPWARPLPRGIVLLSDVAAEAQLGFNEASLRALARARCFVSVQVCEGGTTLRGGRRVCLR